MYKNIFSCEGKVAVVTGGHGLLGREIASSLREYGAKVVIADNNKELQYKNVKSTGINYVYIDISLNASIQNTVDTIVKKFKKIDILINCAYPRTKDWGIKLEKIPLKSWKKNINDHLGGYFMCTRAIAEEMKKHNGGSIINVASIYGVVAPDFSIYEGTDMTMPAAYSAIKGGIIAFSRYLATYYATCNIRVNVISPGGIYDEQDPEFVRRYSKRTPLGRMGTPRDIIGAVLFLASDSSSYITGQNIIIDGGWTIW